MPHMRDETPMKKTVAWLMSYVTYYMGHAAFLVCDSHVWPKEGCMEGSLCDLVFSVFYRIYQTGMRWSLFWNDWGRLGQWSSSKVPF
jgi:hypothetical protein